MLQLSVWQCQPAGHLVFGPDENSSRTGFQLYSWILILATRWHFLHHHHEVEQFWVKHLDNFWIDRYEIWHRHRFAHQAFKELKHQNLNFVWWLPEKRAPLLMRMSNVGVLMGKTTKANAVNTITSACYHSNVSIYLKAPLCLRRASRSTKLVFLIFCLQMKGSTAGCEPPLEPGGPSQ